MASINASTSGAGGVITTADATGILNLQTAGTNAVTVNASQNVGIGTSSPGTKLDIVGASRFRFDTANAYTTLNFVNPTVSAFVTSYYNANEHIFQNSGTDRFIIDITGYTIAGSANVGGIYPTSTAVGVAFGWNFTAGGRDATMMNNDFSGTGVRFVQRTGTSSGSFIGRGGSGGEWNQGNNSSTWTVTSDARIKTNIREINGALDKITALHPCHFEYIDKIGKTKTGFIAQEFETVLAGHVNTQDFVPEEYKDVIPEGEGLKGIDADLIPYLVKAIQEQQTIINDLKSRITALEAK
jgi:hypothetical protein